MNKPKVELAELSETPNLQELKDKFNIGDDAVISYGNSIYVKGRKLSQDLIVHELTHCERQRFNENDAKFWWREYIENEKFRLEEELLAYLKQWNFIKQVFKDRNKLAKIKLSIANEISSERYGNIILQNEAIKYFK